MLIAPSFSIIAESRPVGTERSNDFEIVSHKRHLVLSNQWILDFILDFTRFLSDLQVLAFKLIHIAKFRYKHSQW
jgi:hypothetical protein